MAITDISSVLEADADIQPNIQPNIQTPVSTPCSFPICRKDQKSIEWPRAGKNLTIGSNAELDDGRFIRITSIKQPCSNHGSGTVVKGKLFTRTRTLAGFLHYRVNELVMISAEGQVGMDQLLRPRIIILTNAMFPEHRHYVKNNEVTERECRLVCRWSMTTNGTVSSRLPPENRKPGSIGLIRRLRDDEVDAPFRVRDRHT